MANVTTSFILPDSLFRSSPHPQEFVGVSTEINGTTAYTINCGDNEAYFWPGPNGCDADNSYSFSAAGPNTRTRFLIPKYVQFFFFWLAWVLLFPNSHINVFLAGALLNFNSIDLGRMPLSGTQPVATWLQDFTQK